MTPYIGLINKILNIDDLVKIGREAADRSAAEEYGRSIAQAIRTESYDPAKSRDDKLKEDAYQRDLKAFQEAEVSAAHATTSLNNAERQLAALQTGVAEPKLPRKIAITGTAMLTLSIAPTVHAQFFNDLPDQVVAWTLATSAGA